MYFLRNTSEAWAGQLPTSLVVFIFFHFLQKLVRRWKILARMLSGFKWTASFWRIFLENCQYLSFRVFQQLRDLSPRGLPQGVYYANMIVVYTTLLLVVLLGISFYMYLHKWATGNVLIFWDLTKPSTATIWYVSAYFSFRVCSGATHAMLYEQPAFQLGILLFIQAAMLMWIIKARRKFVSRLTFTFIAYEYTLRTVLYSLLLVEIEVEGHDPDVASCMDPVFASLLEAITFLCLFQLISPYSAEIKTWTGVCSRRKHIIHCKIHSNRSKKPVVAGGPCTKSHKNFP